MQPLRFSQLKHIAKSPAHYRYAISNDRKQEGHERLGSALHALLLGQPERVILWDGRRYGKKYDEWLNQQPQNAIVVNPTEAEHLHGMATNVRDNKQAWSLLRDNQVCEQTLHWRWLGRLCAGTPDSFSLENLVELKTGRTAHPERFVSQGKFYGYHAQLAWYRKAMIQSGLGTPASLWIVAAESSPPYPVTVFRLTEQAIEQGEQACRAWLETLLVCEQSNSWPAYTDAVVPFDVEEGGNVTLRIDGEDVEVA